MGVGRTEKAGQGEENQDIGRLWGSIRLRHQGHCFCMASSAICGTNSGTVCLGPAEPPSERPRSPGCYTLGLQLQAHRAPPGPDPHPWSLLTEIPLEQTPHGQCAHSKANMGGPS